MELVLKLRYTNYRKNSQERTIIRTITFFSISWFFLFWLPKLSIAIESNGPEDGLFRICADIYVDDGNFKIEKERQIFICGDPNSDSWKTIPSYQKNYHLKAILQSEGYHHPNITRNAKGLIVRLGTQSILRSIEVKQSPVELFPKRFWKLYGQPLTPNLLNQIELKLSSVLKSLGYPCYQYEVTPNTQSGIVSISIETKKHFSFPEVRRPNTNLLTEGAIRRYDAFKVGNWYDEALFRLTEKRMIDDSIVESAHFSTTCQSNVLTVNEHIFPGKPRILRYGIGFNTELGPILRGSWSHNRIGRSGSQLKVSAKVSLIEQEISAKSEVYYWPEFNQHFFQPQITVKRSEEKHFSTLNSVAATLLGYDDDIGIFRYEILSGPSFNHTFTFRESSEDDTKTSGYASWKIALLAMTHNYELNLQKPYSGLSANLESNFVSKQIASSFTAVQLSGDIKGFFNLFSFDPSRFILALRAGANSTINPSDNPLEILPPELKAYLGGVNTLRGFERKSLPVTGLGALTSAFSTIELRFTHQLPLFLEPYLFADGGWTGNSKFELDKPFYYSPGIGIGFAPSFGVFNFSLAHGFVEHLAPHLADPIERFQLYFSFGRDF